MSKHMCPVGTMYKDVNMANHIAAIQYAKYGPADPRESEPEFWADKQETWGLTEGPARMRVCVGCRHHDRSPETTDCIIEGPGGDFTESELPVEPKFVDIPDMPVMYCHRWNMTVNPLRTCDQWESEEDDGEDDMSEDEGHEETKSWVTKADTYKPTSGMANAARRALAWKKEGKAGGTRVGMARANQLVRRENLTESTVMRMHSFFSRHAVDKKATGFNSGEEGFPSAGRVAWDLWGGDGGATWAEAKRNQIVRRRESR